MKKFFALLLALIMVAGLAVSCAPKEPAQETPAEEPTQAPATEPTEAPAEQPADEPFNIVVNLASEPMTIDPTLNSAVDGAVMLHHFFEGLIKWMDNGEGKAEMLPGQAESWEISEDGLTYTFHLRDGIKWSDGKDVVAGDFVYAAQRLVNPETVADYGYIADMLVGYPEVAGGTADVSALGVTAPDDKTVVYTLRYKSPYFLELMAFPAFFPVRQDIVEQYGDQWTFDVNTYIGNGPYKMSEWEHNSYIMAVPSETHYDYANLGPDSIKFALMDDQNAMLAGFRSGELNFIEDVPVDEIPALLDSGELHVQDYIGTYYVCFQTQKAPFDDVRVRKAFNLVIDRNYIVEQITRTGQVPATGYVPAGIFDAAGPSGDDFRTTGGQYWSTAKEDYQKNCDEARALLAEAGYPNGEGFPVVEYLYNTSDAHRAIAEALQQMWQQELGVQVTLANQDWAVFLETRKNGDYSIARNGWIADYNDPSSFIDMWITGSGNNDAQYNNPAYDAAVQTAKETSDPAVRMQAYHDAEKMLLDDQVVGPIYFYTTMYMAQGFDGLYYSPLGYYFFAYTKPVA
jgi:oligopeptide transport system substrate-binding protein